MDRKRLILVARREALRRELEKNQEKLRLAIAALGDKKSSLDAYGLAPLMETEETEFPPKIVAFSSNAQRILISRGSELYLYIRGVEETIWIGMVDLDNLIRFIGDDRFLCFRQGIAVIYDCNDRSETDINVSGQILDCFTWKDTDFIVMRKGQKMCLYNLNESEEFEIGDGGGSFAHNEISGHFLYIYGRSGVLVDLDNWSISKTIDLRKSVDLIHIESLGSSSLFMLSMSSDAVVLEMINFSTGELREIKRFNADYTIVKYARTTDHLVLLMENGEMLLLDLRSLQVVQQISLSTLNDDNLIVDKSSNIISINNKIYKIYS